MSSMKGIAACRSSRVGELRLTSSHRRSPSCTEPPGPTSRQLPDQLVGSGERQPGPVRQLGELQDIDTFRKGGNNADHTVHHRITGT